MEYRQSEDFRAICMERDRLLARPEFQRAPVMSKLLHYLVDQKLQPEEEDIKSYTVAVDGLDRGANFDATSDSYPRVQVARLRKLLDRIYTKQPQKQRFIIARGQYEVTFERADTPRNAFAQHEVFAPPASDGAASQHLDMEPAPPISINDMPPFPLDDGNAAAQLNANNAAVAQVVSNHRNIAGIKKRQTVLMAFCGVLMVAIIMLLLDQRPREPMQQRPVVTVHTAAPAVKKAAMKTPSTVQSVSTSDKEANPKPGL